MANYLPADEIVSNLLQFVPLALFSYLFLSLFHLPFSPIRNSSVSSLSCDSLFQGFFAIRLLDCLVGVGTWTVGTYDVIGYRVSARFPIGRSTAHGPGARFRLICYVKTSIASILPPPLIPPPPPRVAERRRVIEKKRERNAPLFYRRRAPLPFVQAGITLWRRNGRSTSTSSRKTTFLSPPLNTPSYTTQTNISFLLSLLLRLADLLPSISVHDLQESST